MNAYELFQHWDSELRPTTLSCIASLSKEQLFWKPSGWHSSAYDLTFHMCNVEWIWIYRNLLKIEPWETMWISKHFGSLQLLLDYWNDVHKVSTDFLKKIPIEKLNERYEMPYKHCPEVSLLWVINHVIEHETHHRGQIVMLMRMMGVKPPEI